MMLFYNNVTVPNPKVSVQSGTSTGWASLGCFSDNGPDGRTLTYPQGVPAGPDGMTVEECTTSCQANGYVLAGLEYSRECYCGNSFSNAGYKQSDMSTCNMACAGNSSETCGGPDRLNVYNFNNTIAASAIPTSAPAGSGTTAMLDWTYLGCYNDSVQSRTLLNQAANNAATVETCISACAKQGYTLAGVEYGGECWCDTSLNNNGALVSDGCNMNCRGNAAETCGGSNRLSLYTPTKLAWQSMGCYTDSVQSRSLRNGVPVTGGGGAMTIESCQAACASAGYKLAGTEYSGECYCDNVIQAGGKPATDGRCNMKCNGNSTQICGGPNGLSLYSLGFYNASSSGSATTTTAAVPSATSNSGVATALPTGWNYTGCYIDQAQGRIMLNEQPDDQKMTVESCVQACASQGYSAAGMEYSYQCFCDNYLRNGAALSGKDSDCAMTCAGNSNEVCGGPNLVSVYSSGSLQIYQPPKAQNTTGSWQYQGCLSDTAVNGRTLPHQILLPLNNTAANCLSQCAAYGYMAGGMEYGQECYCGDLADVQASGATFQPETDCVTPCPGNGTFLCGGGNRLSYYTWQGAAIQNWTYASGNNAGAYTYLTNSPVIPLITTAGRNGKVAVVEKSGTSLTAGSTGAYELDLSLIGSGSNAWRTMHVKTDVFCSAGLTLPDKVGRQINIGGWSATSLFGVRLYWPDGSPGVPGVNDWQENVNSLSMKDGRWYPSAMIMSNGSILVMGGEDGSNGKAVPTLEILPNPNSVPSQHCDYLQRTDPYNLYPFLAVMPSGNIFVSYYNEARLLDPVSLQTVQTLPNIPGSVNNPAGGRTYPLEGSFMLLPQFAPYTDPVTVLICGGSVPGPAIALDNCVSTQPDSNNATWLIERMPSQRVISCMTALPDGTYLILNGAQQGVAGFGLATNPNHNAVLYDPSKPANNRMTIMANTTIDRLYHSEAILLDDGRVLVSGSDPEDQRYTQEYRFETFSPPYLLSGLPQPTFTMNQTDWNYGQSYSFVLTSGSCDNIRVSLMGAVSSTHGNSMGQRTLFPSVRCSGNYCTVTAPPDNKISPPGWFQMFVLDGPTPSHATWVRIGGDPAGLGNWPGNTTDFTVPGL